MARTGARLMQLIDAVLIAVVVEKVDPASVFGAGGVKGWCERNEISTATFYRHKQRIEREGRWEPKSRRPRSSPRRTPEGVEDAIVQWRGKLRGDNGAENIHYQLHAVALRDGWSAKGWHVPPRSTINKVLRRHGLLESNPKKRPKSSYTRFQYAQPRDCYQIDATEVVLAGGPKATVFEVLDDCTRTLVATLVADAETAKAAVAAINTAFDDYGIPAMVLSVNGTAFTAKRTKGAQSQFTRFVTESGARLIHSSPYHPQTNGKVERHHRTFKQWLDHQPRRPATHSALQKACDRYQKFYNTERRHSAVNMPPAQAWANAATLGGPEHLPRQLDATIGHHSVSDSGVISVGHSSVSVGRAHAGLKVTVLRNGDHVTVFHITGDVLGHLHLDRDKRYQGQLHAPAA